MTCFKCRYSILLFVLGFLGFGLAVWAAEDVMAPEAIEARIKPLGQVKVIQQKEDQTAPTEEKKAESPGEKIYNQYCSACHTAGVAGAPKKGSADWNERLKKGKDKLLESVTKGLNAMPPKGTCNECTPEEFKAAIEYMVSQ